MIRVSVMYPTGDGKTFDYEYYAKKRMGMVRDPNVTNITPQVQISEVILPS